MFADDKIAVYNNKGGVGKTTISIILTQIALMDGKKVLDVDRDEQNNFNFSINYLKDDANFKDKFAFQRKLTDEDFKRNDYDFMIIDCPPTFNYRSRFAVSNADIILIPVRPDYYSIMNLFTIRQMAGDAKDLLHFPIVKVGFRGLCGNLVRRINKRLYSDNYKIIGDLPINFIVTNNILSNRYWSERLYDSARRPYDLLYENIKLLYQTIQEKRKEDLRVKNYGTFPSFSHKYDYYDDPENPDISIFGR